MLAANVVSAAACRLRGLDGALEVVGLGPRQLEPPAVRRFEALSRPGEGAVESVTIHDINRSQDHARSREAALPSKR